MKRLTLSTLLIIVAFLLSSCALHLGLSKILGSGSAHPKNSSGSGGKHNKGTGTPPSPTGSPAPGSIISQATPLSVGHGKAITITTTGFQPNVLKPKKGKSVTWTNIDSVPQEVTSDPAGLFDSGVLKFGAAYTFTFASSGIFKYHSITDPSWSGTVIIP